MRRRFRNITADDREAETATITSLMPGRYLLAGSTRYETLPRAAQSLTGRAHVMTIWPLSQGEIHGVVETFVEQVLKDPQQLVGTRISRTSREDYVARIVAGGFPIALRRQGSGHTRWFADYVNLVCERDVLDISRVHQRASLPRLLTRLAGQTCESAQRRSGSARNQHGGEDHRELHQTPRSRLPRPPPACVGHHCGIQGWSNASR